MACFEIENVSFSYAGSNEKALDGICLTVKKSDFVTVCGASGSGKTTLLRLLKPVLAPHGIAEGRILFDGTPLTELDERKQAETIGFVMQSPDNQLVTDKVWHELAFGLESLGCPTDEIRARVSEMASFFGIETWFHNSVSELSGGQKQLLNLAAVMVMQPDVLLLDEPTSRLDPIAAEEFLRTVKKINEEFGTTVILSEHRLEDAIALSDRVIVMDRGRIIADDAPLRIGKILKGSGHEMYASLPAPMRIYEAVEGGADCPVTIRDGRLWLESYAECHTVKPLPHEEPAPSRDSVIDLRDVWFRYEKNLPDVVKGLDLSVGRGEFLAILGGNGTGKTTLLSLISGRHTPYRGKVRICGKNLSELPDLYDAVLGVLPQEPTTLFSQKTVRRDLAAMLSDSRLSDEEKERRLAEVCSLCRIGSLTERHPYDLSGGEQQRVALAMLLLKSPEILLLDEPTKGFDTAFKKVFADILNALTKKGVTVVMVSHDIEFCAEYADRCALVFDGRITSVGTPREFFSGKNFYTTAANRMARTVLPDAVLSGDVLAACGVKEFPVPEKPEEKTEEKPPKEKAAVEKDVKKQNIPVRRILGAVFGLAFLLATVSYMSGADFLHIREISWMNTNRFSLISIALVFAVLFLLLPKEKNISEIAPIQKHSLPKRTILASGLTVLIIPLTIFIGVRYFEGKNYYFLSLLILLETFLPFAMIFESRKPKAREIVMISVLCAIAVAGRAAFAMLPQFKPVTALVIISGVCFGGETGFLVGSMTAFVSNFLFGQGPWTPWQMFAFGSIGFLAGILYKTGILGKTKLSLCLFGAASTLVIYGGIMNPASVIMSQTHITWEMIAASYLSGLPFDLIHAASTVLFLWFIAAPMIEKLERIKTKYGLIDESDGR